MSRSEQKRNTEQPKPESQPKEQEKRKSFRLVELETRVTPNAVWTD